MATPNALLFPAGVGVPDVDGSKPGRLDASGRVWEPREGILRILGAWGLLALTRGGAAPGAPIMGHVHLGTPSALTGSEPATTNPNAVFWDGTTWQPFAPDTFWAAVVKAALTDILSSDAGNVSRIGTDGGLFSDVPLPASQPEVEAGTDPLKFVTPATLRGMVASQALVNAGIDAESYVTPLSLETKQQSKGVLAYSAGALSVPSGLDTLVTDIATVVRNDYAGSLAAGQFTVPGGRAGWYRISAGAGVSGAVANVNYGVNIHVNGTIRASQRSRMYANCVTLDRYLNAGDMVNVSVHQATGIPRTLTAGETFLACVRLP